MIFKKFNIAKSQATINNNPPMGVIKPITLKSKVVSVFVDNKNIEPEKNTTPKTTKYKIIVLTF